MVAIKNDSASALMALSRRFANTADNVARASSLDFAGQRAVRTTAESRPSVPPATQSENLFPPAVDWKLEIDLVEEMVHLHTTEAYYVANLKVLATKDEVQKAVLDIVV